MTDRTTPDPSTPADPGSTEHPNPTDRGTLEVHPSVVRKVAARAAGRGASVKVTGEDSDVDIAVRLALPYPVRVRAAAAEVRRSVTEEVQRITGYRVRWVDVVVSALVSEPRPRVE